MLLISCGSSGSGGDTGEVVHSGEEGTKEDVGGVRDMDRHEMNHGSGQEMSMGTVKPESVGLRVRFTSEPAAPRPDRPVELGYRVIDAGNGWVLTDLPIDHERPMHLIVVSRDLEHFQHVHPEVGPGGDDFVVTTAFPEVGIYVLYDEFKHRERTVLDRRELRVGEGSDASAPLSPDLTPKAEGGVEISLAAPKPVKAGEEADFTFTLTSDGNPVTDLEPYLGAAAHVAIVSANTQEFAHTHGEAVGDAQGAEGHLHEGHEGMRSPNSGDAALGPEITFRHRFPHPGLYKVWGQFSRDGRVITVPYVVEAV